uniref:FBA_2 domain-containing protein n=1 Tax=Caenorhabditis tropicalis TaxID=1561998 RepID=A0A1I7UAS4_9PELO
MSRQNSIAECSYHCEETSDEEVTYFLDTLKVTKELEVYAETSENFQYSFKYPMNLESLFVHPGPYPWLTLNNLIETNPRYLELFGPKFTNEEMNLFIRNWINGGNSNLQAVVMRLKLVDTEIIMNGIPAVWRETEEDLSYEL